MNKKFLVGFSVLSVAAAAFWACGDGDVITKGGDDELALLNYGPPFAEGDEGNMKTLLNQAMTDCAADEACAAKMEGAEYVPPESSAEGGEGGDGGNGGEAPTSSPSGPVSNGSGPVSSPSVTPTGSSGSGSNTTPASSAVVSDGSTPDGSCAPSPTSVRKGNPVTWTFTVAPLSSGSTAKQIMDYNEMVNAATCEWTLTGSSEGTASQPCKTKTVTATYTTPNSYSATLKIRDKVINCGSVRVNGDPIEGCSCKPTSETVDVAKDASASWNVSCKSAVTKYSWSGATGTGATGTMSLSGVKAETPLTPKVTVSTGETDSTITCTSPAVIDSDHPKYEISEMNGKMPVPAGENTLMVSVGSYSFFYCENGGSDMSGSSVTCGSNTYANATTGNNNSGWYFAVSCNSSAVVVNLTAAGKCGVY